MKKSILISSIFGVSALVAFAQDATPTYDLYYDRVISTTTPTTDNLASFTDANDVVHSGITYKYKDSNGVEQSYTGELGANTNITLNITEAEGFSGTYSNSLLFNYGNSTTLNEPLTLGNLKYYINTSSASSYRLLGQYADPLTVKSLEVELDSKSPTVNNFVQLSFNTTANSSIFVENDFTVRNTGTKYWNMRVTFNYCGTISVGGDFIVSNDKGKVELEAGSTGWKWGHFTIGGALKIETAAGNYALWKYSTGNWEDTKRNLGGLDVAHSGVIALEANSDTATSMTSSLTFTNASTHEFVGSIVRLSTAVPHNLNITMNATDATNGRQILRFDEYIGKSGSGLNEKYEDAKEVLNNIVVNSGRLDIGMHANGMYAKSLALNGADAVFSSTALMTNEEIGYTNFASANLTKGTLVFDYSIDANDTIAINDALTVANASDITIILQEIDGFDIKTWLQDEGMDSFSFDILSFESTNLTEESIADINVVSSNGMDAVLSAIKTDGVITGIQATIAVPEPATVAAIFGAFALAFVAYRRRK